MKFRRSGPNFIEDGIVRARRVCVFQEGDDPATCEGTTFAERRNQAEEGIRTREANAPSRANLPALNAEPFDRVFLMEGVGACGRITQARTG